jgi:4-hydroxy-tetrahydrodipicolinate reductase
MKAVALAVHGASGRMGQALLREAATLEDVQVVAALVGSHSALLGQPAGANAGGLAYAAALPPGASPDVLVDFSLPGAFDAALALARGHGIAFLGGTTGLSPMQQAALADAAARIPVLWSANFSLGVAVLAQLVEEAARLLPEWDCAISEAHHRGKRDAPSGTALALGRAVAAARGQAFDDAARTGPAGGERVAGEIGFAVTRAGDIAGEHGVLFATAGERLELVHRATDRAVFARGALRAARWLARRPAGLYTLRDLLADRG